MSDPPRASPITNPVQALRREELLDALPALLRTGHLPPEADSK